MGVQPVVWEVTEARTWLDRIGRALRAHHEPTVRDVPRRWVDLILYLDELEQRQTEAGHSGSGRDGEPPR